MEPALKAATWIKKISIVALLVLLSFYSIIYQRKENTNRYLIEYIQQSGIVLDSLYRLSDSLSKELNRYDPETVWLARGIYSETNDSLEMLYVGKVIQNRYQMQFNGKTTYKDVVLDPWQFSGFNKDNPRRYINLSRSITSIESDKVWKQALDIAYRIRISDLDTLQFDATHFYSEVSMVPRKRIPKWTEQMQIVDVQHVDDRRFRFYQSF